MSTCKEDVKFPAPLLISPTDKKIHESHVGDSVGPGGVAKNIVSQRLLHSNTSTVLEIEDGKWGKHIMKVFEKSSICMGYRELAIMATCRHPGIQRVLYAHHSNDRLYIGMPHSGIDTVSYIAKNGPLSGDLAEKWMLSASRAVQYLHDRGIVHADIKPSNFVVNESGDPSTLVLIDYELAGRGRRNDTAVTLPHRAPEILLGKAWGKSADIWALGTTFFYWVTGRHFLNHPICAKDDSESRKFALDAIRRWACYGAFRDLPLHCLPVEEQVAHFRVIWPIEKRYTLMIAMLRYYPAQRMDINGIIGVLTDFKGGQRLPCSPNLLDKAWSFFKMDDENLLTLNEISGIVCNPYRPFFPILAGMCRALCIISNINVIE